MIKYNLTAKQRELMEKHGHPGEFAVAVYKAVPSFISMDEAEESIRKYNREWAEAGGMKSATLLKIPFQEPEKWMIAVGFQVLGRDGSIDIWHGTDDDSFSSTTEAEAIAKQHGYSIENVPRKEGDRDVRDS